MAGLNFEEDARTMRSQLNHFLQAPIFFSLVSLFMCFCLSMQVSVAYKAKLDELKNQGLDEEELNKNLVPLKVSFSPVYFVYVFIFQKQNISFADSNFVCVCIGVVYNLVI